MIYVLYHSPCIDGFTAAYAAWTKFGNDHLVTYVPCRYHEPLPEIEDGSHVYILDFSYPREILVELAERCLLVVIDHHESAQKDLEGLSFAHFDMKKPVHTFGNLAQKSGTQLQINRPNLELVAHVHRLNSNLQLSCERRLGRNLNQQVPQISIPIVLDPQLANDGNGVLLKSIVDARIMSNRNLDRALPHCFFWIIHR